MSMTTNSKNTVDCFCLLNSLSETNRRSTYDLGHRLLFSWLWRIGILGNRFAANRKHNRAEQFYKWSHTENEVISLIKDTNGSL